MTWLRQRYLKTLALSREKDFQLTHNQTKTLVFRYIQLLLFRYWRQKFQLFFQIENFLSEKNHFKRFLTCQRRNRKIFGRIDNQKTKWVGNTDNNIRTNRKTEALFVDRFAAVFWCFLVVLVSFHSSPVLSRVHCHTLVFL